MLTALHPSAGQQQPAQPDPARLRQIVEVLASPEFSGRAGAGAEKAAAYLVDQFRELKLEPLFDGEFLQPIPGKDPGTVQGKNAARGCAARTRCCATSG